MKIRLNSIKNSLFFALIFLVSANCFAGLSSQNTPQTIRDEILKSLKTWSRKDSFVVPVKYGISEIRDLENIRSRTSVFDQAMRLYAWEIASTVIQYNAEGADEILEYLIKNCGLDPNLRQPGRKNPRESQSLLLFATNVQNPGAVQVLLRHQADPKDYFCAKKYGFFGPRIVPLGIVDFSRDYESTAEATAANQKSDPSHPLMSLTDPHLCDAQPVTLGSEQHSEQTFKPIFPSESSLSSMLSKSSATGL